MVLLVWKQNNKRNIQSVKEAAAEETQVVTPPLSVSLPLSVCHPSSQCVTPAFRVSPLLSGCHSSSQGVTPLLYAAWIIFFSWAIPEFLLRYICFLDENYSLQFLCDSEAIKR